MIDKDRWYDFVEALAITAGLMTASGAMFAALSRLLPIPGIQYLVALAVLFSGCGSASAQAGTLGARSPLHAQ